jgi:hypothetical protein
MRPINDSIRPLARTGRPEPAKKSATIFCAAAIEVNA